MKDALEVIAQQIDKVAAHPLEAVLFLAGPIVFWQYLGWWAAVGFLAIAFLMVAAVDVVVYLMRRYTYAKYGDTSIYVDGFHPFKARAVARAFDREIKKHGEEVVIEELRKLGAVVHEKEDGPGITIAGMKEGE